MQMTSTASATGIHRVLICTRAWRKLVWGSNGSSTCFMFPVVRGLVLFGLQSLGGDKALKLQAVCPKNGAPVLKWFIKEYE